MGEEVWGASHHVWRLSRGIAEQIDKRQLGERITALAETQHGVVSVAQLYALGLSKDEIAGRVHAGWLRRVHRGVYAVGRELLSFEGKLLAATLACRGSMISHLSAANLWRIHSERAAAVEVTVRRPGGGGPKGLLIHRSLTIHRGEATIRAGIPVTTPARTLLDVAGILSPRQLERAADEAERLHGCDTAELIGMVAGHRGHRGAGALGRLLRTHELGSTMTRTKLEEAFLGLCRQHQLPQPLVNAPLHGLTPDFLWEAAKLVVEVDGRGSHDTRRGFEDDRDRDSLLAVHGYLTLRFTWRDVTRRPAVVAHRVARVLRDRSG